MVPMMDQIIMMNMHANDFVVVDMTASTGVFILCRSTCVCHSATV